MADVQAAGNGDMRKVTIAGEIFDVRAPYREGHVCTANEANVLNQTRAENIGNNFRKELNAVDKDEAGAWKAEWQEKVSKYDAEYEFGKAGIRISIADPYEREARAIAREAIKAQLAEEGRKIDDVDEDRLEAAISGTAQQDDVMALARERVDARKRSRAVKVVGDISASLSEAEEEQSAA